MQPVLAAARTVFLQLNTTRVVAPILLGYVVALLALDTCQSNVCANCFLSHFSKTFAATPTQLRPDNIIQFPMRITQES
jgi:hypothetical protein